MDFTDPCSLLLWNEWKSRKSRLPGVWAHPRKSYCLALELTLPGRASCGLAYRTGAGQRACLPSSANGSKSLITFLATAVLMLVFLVLSCPGSSLSGSVMSSHCPQQPTMWVDVLSHLIIDYHRIVWVGRDL